MKINRLTSPKWCHSGDPSGPFQLLCKHQSKTIRVCKAGVRITCISSQQQPHVRHRRLLITFRAMNQRPSPRLIINLRQQCESGSGRSLVWSSRLFEEKRRPRGAIRCWYLLPASPDVHSQANPADMTSSRLEPSHDTERGWWQQRTGQWS